MSTLVNKDYHLAFEQVLRVYYLDNFFFAIYTYRSLTANSDDGTHSNSSVCFKEPGQKIPHSHIKIPPEKRTASAAQVE